LIISRLRCSAKNELPVLFEVIEKGLLNSKDFP